MFRVKLVKAKNLVSSYKKKYKPSERWDVKVFQEGSKITPDMFLALKKLDISVKQKQGNLYITDLFRSWSTQHEARLKFESGQKESYVSLPGSSFHNSGRAVDISVQELNFKNYSKDNWLEVFWDIAKPLGFYPIISIPAIDASEAWHFDFPGNDWGHAYKHLSYKEVAKCCTLDVGKWDPDTSKDIVNKMFLQSQLVRLRFYEVGKVDGIIGEKTKKALQSCTIRFGFSVDLQDVQKTALRLSQI